jgi:fibronectin type 3 domain-containing protein
VISWDDPKTNENGTSPANAVAYNIYRSLENGSWIKLNDEPVEGSHYQDTRFEFGKKYQYMVRALSTLSADTSVNNAIESNGSKPITVSAEDTFSPTAPAPITIASIGGLVSLYWPLNSEPDVAGYNIYRSDVDQATAEKWVKINQQLHKTASFRDDKVEVGKQYYYQITAVDIYGNESERSETKSETVNP